MTETLTEITKAEAEAAEAAQKAAAAAEAARIRADRARERAEQERAAANRRYLDLLVAEHETARTDALTALGESRQALETAVLSGGDAFGAYVAYVRASVGVWQIESALAEQRHYHGLPVRETTRPEFSFTHDIARIIDNFAADSLDEAIQANRERRAQFLAGQETQ